jgi:nucleotide-binding universal stress UspA family protein
MGFHHIMCPVDFSVPSRRALDTAIAMAKAFNCQLTLLHVYPPPGYVLPEGFVPAGPEVLLQVEEQTRKALQAWADEAQAAGAHHVDIATAAGFAAGEIGRHIGALKADLVVMGTHGRTGLAHVVLGSTAERVLRHSHVPVLTVPAKD